MKQNKKWLQGVALTIALLLLLFAAGHADSKRSRIQVVTQRLSVRGLTESHRMLLLADTHISLCDERDAGLMEKAAARRKSFAAESGRSATQVFTRFVDYANEKKPQLVLLGGDILDSAMYASVDFLKENLDRLTMPYLYTLGNHDFEYGQEYFSKKAYAAYLPRLSAVTDTTKQYEIVEYADLRIIGMNDKNNQLDAAAVRAVLPYLNGKKPVIVMLHVPLQPMQDGGALEEEANTVWGTRDDGSCRVLLGDTACRPNKWTKKFLDAVFAADSPVAAVLAGHVHFYNRAMLDDSTVQYITGAGYHGDAVMLELVPASVQELLQQR